LACKIIDMIGATLVDLMFIEESEEDEAME
jgi:hypothetical protein